MSPAAADVHGWALSRLPDPRRRRRALFPEVGRLRRRRFPRHPLRRRGSPDLCRRRRGRARLSPDLPPPSRPPRSLTAMLLDVRPHRRWSIVRRDRSLLDSAWRRARITRRRSCNTSCWRSRSCCRWRSSRCANIGCPCPSLPSASRSRRRRCWCSPAAKTSSRLRAAVFAIFGSVGVRSYRSPSIVTLAAGVAPPAAPSPAERDGARCRIVPGARSAWTLLFVLVIALAAPAYAAFAKLIILREVADGGHRDAARLGLRFRQSRAGQDLRRRCRFGRCPARGLQRPPRLHRQCPAGDLAHQRRRHRARRAGDLRPALTSARR